MSAALALITHSHIQSQLHGSLFLLTVSFAESISFFWFTCRSLDSHCTEFLHLQIFSRGQILLHKTNLFHISICSILDLPFLLASSLMLLSCLAKSSQVLPQAYENMDLLHSLSCHPLSLVAGGSNQYCQAGDSLHSGVLLYRLKY